MPITALYAGLLGLFFIFLAVNVIRTRRAAGISLGSGDNASLESRIRAHGNFAEYAPIALVLMALAEAGGSAGWLVHGIGILLLAGRGMHAFSLSHPSRPMGFRVAGMSLTFTAIAIASLACFLAAAG